MSNKLKGKRMAMNKKEQAEMKAAIDRADLLAALRWTAPVAFDVPPLKDGTYSEGWTFNTYTKTVVPGWSTSVRHGSGPAPDGNKYCSGSQNAQWMYSTEALALAAMRHELELSAAKTLMDIDRRLSELMKVTG